MTMRPSCELSFSCEGSLSLAAQRHKHKHKQVKNKHVPLLCWADKEFKQTTTTVTRTPPNKRFNEKNNGCARA